MWQHCSEGKSNEGQEEDIRKWSVALFIAVVARSGVRTGREKYFEVHNISTLRGDEQKMLCQFPALFQPHLVCNSLCRINRLNAKIWVLIVAKSYQCFLLIAHKAIK